MVLWTGGYALYTNYGCNGWNIRWVVAGACKEPYEDRMGAGGCDRLGVM